MKIILFWLIVLSLLLSIIVLEAWKEPEFTENQKINCNKGLIIYNAILSIYGLLMSVGIIR